MPRRLIALCAAGAALLAAAPALAGSTPSRTVDVGDNFFSRERLTVNKNTRLVFRWLSENNVPHDVTLDSAPRGVTKWHSPLRTKDYTYRRTVRKAGTYKIICTLHPTQMRLTVRVRR
jgi:plastocyanin